MYFVPHISSAPGEVPLSFVDKLEDFTTEGDVLHDMIRSPD